MTAIPDTLDDVPTPIEPVGLGNETRTFFASELHRRGHDTGPIDPRVVAEILAANEDRRFVMFEKRRRDRFVSRIKIWLPVAATILAGLGYGGTRLAAEDPDEVKPADVRDDVREVDDRIEQNAEVGRINSENIGTLAELAVEQQELTVEAMDHVVEVVKAGPRHADEVDKPAGLRDAEDAVTERKRKSKAGDLLKQLPDANK